MRRAVAPLRPLPLPACFALLIGAAALVLAAPVLRAAPPAEVRALWVTRVSLSSEASIASLVQSARASGFNTLLVQVRGRGDAYYASTIDPRGEILQNQRQDFDPLAAVIEKAHAEGLRVHAWINVSLVASAAELPSARAHVIYRHPEWLMLPRPLAYPLTRLGSRSPEFLGRLARWTRGENDVEGMFLSSALPEAATYTVQVVDEIVSRYAVDGVHLDYIRYPGPQFDYNPSVLRRFLEDLSPALSDAERRRVDPLSVADLIGVTDRYPQRWEEFRRSRLNALVLRIRTVVKNRRPESVLSAAVFPDAAEAASRRFQDWRLWVENRWIDVLCPMAYTPEAAVFAAQISSARTLAGLQPVWAGIGAYRLSPAQTVENIEAARRLGARGVILFSYDSLVRPPRGAEVLASIGRAAFAP